MREDLIERLCAYITQREKIRDGGITITECNGVPLTLTDLREAAAALESSRADAARLEDALREAYGQVRELCDAHVHPYPEASFARYEAALFPTTAQDGK